MDDISKDKGYDKHVSDTVVSVIGLGTSEDLLEGREVGRGGGISTVANIDE
jgi:hypothetical protein